MRSLYSFLFSLLSLAASGKDLRAFADSVRRRYDIPEVAIAIVSADKVLEMDFLGVHRRDANEPAHSTDRFRIGSNTKTVTAFIAAQLVKQGKISWDTKFFALFPELKEKSNPAYHNLTLLNLLSFRTRLCRYTYTNDVPARDQFTGSDDQQRYQFMQWCLRQRPLTDGREPSFSNPGYTAAGLMLEKASGKKYKQLVAELGKELNIDFHFGSPNADTLQPWGHNATGSPEPLAYNVKLEWLLAAGNINVSLPDYAKFIQLQLKGLKGKSGLLSKDEFRFLHYGLPSFSVGWFWNVDERGSKYSWHVGNPGTFLSQVYVFSDKDRAYILFANQQSDKTEQGLSIIYEEMKRDYNK